MDQPALPWFGPQERPQNEAIPVGRDELNLAEFPICLLGDRVPRGLKTLEFEDTVYDRQAGTRVTRRLTVTGSDRYGLPTASDDEILVALIQLTRLRDFADRHVEFTRGEIIAMMGWNEGGDSYVRVEESLNRWVGVTLYYDKAWWDRAAQAWVDAKFHMLESVFLVKPGDRKRAAARREPTSSRFSWNEVVFASFRAENLKRLDVAVYFALRSSVARRMYRFLDKRFYLRARWEFDLADFAREHVGLSRNYAPSKLKEKLASAIEELEAIGFLAPMGTAGRYPKAGRGSWSIVLERGDAACDPRSPSPAARGTDLERELVARGVRPPKATELAAGPHAGRVRSKLEAFDRLAAVKDRRIARNPAGYLVKSIEDDYAPPAGFGPPPGLAAAASESPPRDSGAELRRAEMAQECAIRARIAAHWEALPPADRERLDAEALSLAEASLAESYRGMKATRNPAAAGLMKVIRDVHIRKELGLPAPAGDAE
ncbi:replication initiator protein A (plasmid) [Isosphaeraceae bacterium EP7]